ncbi:MAG: hypothetical protein WA728_34755 [Xanthobacteraceae bacterium]
MDRANAERQRRYIARLKERASAGETEEETDERIKTLAEEIARLRGDRREVERLRRQLENAPPPDIHNGMPFPSASNSTCWRLMIL